MDELEELLELEDIGLKNEGIESYDYPAMAKKIEKTFIDAGWAQEPRQYDAYGKLKINGDEFYANYKMELGFGSLDDIKDRATGDYLKGIEVTEMKCDEAAKRAAGIEKGL